MFIDMKWSSRLGRNAAVPTSSCCHTTLSWAWWVGFWRRSDICAIWQLYYNCYMIARYLVCKSNILLYPKLAEVFMPYLLLYLQKNMQDKTPYTIMFGPDKCGSDDKVSGCHCVITSLCADLTVNPAIVLTLYCNILFGYQCICTIFSRFHDRTTRNF